MNKRKKGIFTFIKFLSAFIVLGAALGAIGSFYTGQAQELPKFNGQEYLIFCSKLGVYGALVFGLPASILIALVKNKNNNKKQD